MRVYISGPISDIPNGNRTAFEKAEAMLLELGYEPVNPHKLSPLRRADEGDEEYYERCMAIDLEALEWCERIYFLPNWMLSRGAVREWEHAMKLGIEVLT